jgi:hypothetical protein
MFASWHGHPSTAQLLLEAGSNKDDKDKVRSRVHESITHKWLRGALECGGRIMATLRTVFV